MPLVRIITRLREYPTELVRDLRTRGFEVETCLSRDEKQEAADLEITLDQCSPEGMSESISHALANKDVVILADANASHGRIRSIGMVLMSAEADVQTARKTAVPVQLNEIYAALLRGRLQPRKYIAFPTDWESTWQKARLASHQQLRSAWKYSYTTGKNLGEFGGRTISEAGIWARSKRWTWSNRANSPKVEPDLVPSMFNLSGDFDAPAELPAQMQEVPQPVNTKNRSTFSFWKPIGIGAIAILTVTLWLHGFSLSGSNANHASAESKKDINAQSQTLLPATHTMQKAGIDDAASATKILAKSHVSGDDPFQEVVVRHFDQPAPRGVPKDGIKRRVVVD
jgi:hypothetical protein